MSVVSTVPEYGSRSRYTPIHTHAFGDGGAFPEILLTQYPLGMGKTAKGTSATLPAQSLAANTALLLQQGHQQNNNVVIHSTVQDMQPANLSSQATSILKPDQARVDQVTIKTRLALEAVLGGSAISKTNLDNKPKDPTYVKYTPSESNTNNLSAASSRIIRLSEAPIDPMEPARFKHRKIPRSKGSPPPPVLRSPPRKVSVAEQKNWVIPPCISNWKNAKGYTIPLDKRLANDGRGLQDVTINDNFAKFSEALFIADRHARDEVRLRGDMQGKLITKQKAEKEERLRSLAQAARNQRTISNFNPNDLNNKQQSYSDSDEDSAFGVEEESLSVEDQQKLKERQELRREMAKEREREARSEKTSKSRNITQRDISEKIALGVAQPTISKEGAYDQRLFNQTSGMNTGFGGDDSYDLYDKPLFSGSSANAIYRPKKTETEIVDGVASEKITALLNRPHRGFEGTDSTEDIRSGPVLFEKESDVFGVNAFMSAAKRGRNPSDDVAEGGKKGRVGN